MNSVQFAKATAQDAKRLAGLASEIWHEYYVRIITVEQIDYMIETFQSENAIASQIEHQGYEYFFMIADGKTVGYLAIKQEENKLFLSKFYILKAYRGNGYASRAVDFLATLCKDRGLSAIWLTVNRFNEQAIAVYEKKGFQKVRAHAADIGNGFVMDDYIMEKEIILAD
jgi:ribosomal protein S18 acetylase RimI-like enzyme